MANLKHFTGIIPGGVTKTSKNLRFVGLRQGFEPSAARMIVRRVAKSGKSQNINKIFDSVTGH